MGPGWRTPAVILAFPPEERRVAVGMVGAAGSFGQDAMPPGGHALMGAFGSLNALLVFAARFHRSDSSTLRPSAAAAWCARATPHRLRRRPAFLRP